jgi:hypothetical protein
MRNAQEHPVECIPNHENLSLKFTSIQSQDRYHGYCPEGVAFKMGDEAVRACQKQADQSWQVYVGGRPAEELWRKNQKIKRIRRRAQALRTKVQAVRRDVHRKICRFLCDNLTPSFYPNLTPSAWARSVGGTSSQTVRNMMTFAHGVQSVLGSLCQGPWCHRRSPSEAFTTKTCTGCGFVREVGGVHTFTVSDADCRQGPFGCEVPVAQVPRDT